MISTQPEKRLSIILSLGIALTILAVTTFISIEPVNTPKQLVLTIIGMISWLTLLINIGLKKLLSQNRILIAATFSFALLSLINIFISSAPRTQTFYGSFGRSTGALTYISLIGILLLYSNFNSANSFRFLVYAIIFSGVVNAIYCGIDILGPDLLGWNNTYGAILGTLGNPNFVSSFLAISAITAIPFLLSKNKGLKLKIGILIYLLVALVEIVESNSRQGIIVFVFGFIIAIYIWIRTNSKIQKLSPYFLATSVMLGILGILGTLQIGPLAKFLYKTSVSLRGVYWKTGISIGEANPVSGIGFDSYGDYYREFRDEGAMISPGPTVVTNSAHNVVIDIFASGGYPLLISYLTILGIGILSVTRIVRKMKKFDPVPVALITGWMGYQAQSFISINQIGLAICGWALTGSLVGYHKHYLNEIESPKDLNKSQRFGIRSSLIPIGLGSAIGLAIALPPFIADAQWRSALNRGDGAAIIKNATQWPKDTYRMTNIAFALEKSNLPDDALKIARENVKNNPRSYDAWKLLVQLSKSTPDEKKRGVEMLHKLDPLNTELK